jgi:hypothetical protein
MPRLDRKRLPAISQQAFVRTLVFPLPDNNYFPSHHLHLLGAFGLIRRDGRMFHDSGANTGIVYCWDAQPSGHASETGVETIPTATEQCVHDPAEFFQC